MSSPFIIPKPIDDYLLTQNPGLYAASRYGQPTPSDAAQLDSIQHVLSIGNKLRKELDLGKARTSFQKLDPQMQAALIALNPEAEYTKKPFKRENIFMHIAKPMVSPFKEGILAAGETWTKAYNYQYKFARNIGDKFVDEGLSGLFNYLSTRRNYSDLWDGHNQWDNSVKEKLIQEHGSGMSLLVRNLIDGKRPEDTIKEYGNINTPEFQYAIIGFSDYGAFLEQQATGNKDAVMTPQALAYKNAYDAHAENQINPGNDITNWLNNSHPPSDGGTWGMGITLGLSVLAGATGSADVPVSTKGDKWRIANWNPFAKEKFISPSGLINGYYQFLADPLTYASGGSTTVIKQSAKLATRFSATAEKLGTPKAVDEIFANPNWYANHEKLVGLVNELRDLRISKTPSNDSAAGKVRETIKKNFPGYDDDQLINALVNKKVLNDLEEDVFVTDMKSLRLFFNKGEYNNYIINGKVNNVNYYRENNVMLQRNHRIGTDGIAKATNYLIHGGNPDAIEASIVKKATTRAERAKELESFYSSPTKWGLLNNDVNPDMLNVVNSLTGFKKNVLKRTKKAFSNQPEDVMIHWTDDLVDTSLGAFRDFVKLVHGGSDDAYLLTERYLRLQPEDRFKMLFSMAKLYTDKIGFGATQSTLQAQSNLLETMFHLETKMGPVEFDIPKQLEDTMVFSIDGGPSQGFHSTLGMSMPKWNMIHNALYETEEKMSALHFYKAFTYNKMNNLLGRSWVAWQLIPKLGIKSIVDESTINALVKSPTILYNTFLNPKAKQINNAIIAFKGDIPKSLKIKDIDNSKFLSTLIKEGPSGAAKLLDSRLDKLAENLLTGDMAVGFFKGRAKIKLAAITNNPKFDHPANFVPAAVRIAMQEIQKRDVSYTLKSGREIQQFEFVPADIYFGAPYADRLASMVIARFAGKLSSREKEILHFHLTNNTYSSEGLVKSTVGQSMGNTLVVPEMLKETVKQSELYKYLDANNLKFTDVQRTEKGSKQLLKESSRTGVHYTNFHIMLGKNLWEYKPTGVSVDFGNTFFKWNAIKTKADANGYVRDVMNKIGFEKSSQGEWRYKVAPEGKTKEGVVILGDNAARKTVRAFNSKQHQSADLRNAGATPAEISESLIRHQLNEIITVFHGSANNYNKGLVELIQDRLDFAKEKILKNEEWLLKNAKIRAENKAPKLYKSEAETKSYEDYVEKVSKASYQATKISYAEFEDVTQGVNKLKGELQTSIDFPELADTAVKWYSRIGQIGWSIMDRQLSDMFRVDSFVVHLFEQRKKLTAAEDTWIRDTTNLMLKENEGMLYEDAFEAAYIQGQFKFDNIATSNAVSEVLKYGDNPAVRSQLAFNARSVGRFNRATEDYWKRMFRYVKEHPGQVVYRTAHFQQAMDASGITYEDENGVMYILLPNDGIIFDHVFPAFMTLMNPLQAGIAAGKAIGNGDWSFFKQPQWNQNTLKISMVNPSYSEGSGLYALQGPTMAIGVLTAKTILSLLGQRPIAEELDNLILGPQSDNTNWVRAAFPSSLRNVLTQLPSEHEDAQHAVTLMQAGAILQMDEETAFSSQDYADTDKTKLYIDRLGIAVHNLLTVKAAFNTVSAIPVGNTVPGVPSELRKLGVINFRQEFNQILRAVLANNMRNDYYIDDPINFAVTMFIGSYPDKLIWTVSKDSKAVRAIINYTKETKAWVLQNTKSPLGKNKLLDLYGEVGYIFAPNVGKYDPGVVKFFEAADIVSLQDNPFRDKDGLQTSPLYRYLKEIASVKARADYYNVDREVMAKFNDPNNLERNMASYRNAELQKAKDKKAYILMQNPTLKYILGTSDFDTREGLKDKFLKLTDMVNSPNLVNVISEEQRFILQKMTKQASSMIAAFSGETIRQQYQGMDALATVRKEGLANLEKLAATNPAANQAYLYYIRPYLDNLYQPPVKP